MSHLDIEIPLRLFAAFILGGVLGLNRELHGKPAGFRTHALVCLGAAAATMAALYAGRGVVPDASAASRVVQGVLTGIGFLGAGVILRDPKGNVSGLTTAATIWISAVVGFVAGMGYWTILGCTFVFTICALVFGRELEKLTDRLFRRKPSQTKEEEHHDA